MFIVLELPPQPWTVPVARQALDGLLIAEGVAAGTRERLAVVLTEACANVVQHSGVPDPYRVCVEVAGDDCVIEVTDCGVGFDPARVRAAMPDPACGVSGRGLPLIRALADTLTVERLKPRGMKVRAITDLRQRRDSTHDVAAACQ
jgi:serine/threonine-protein kinase RsbW